MARQGQHLQDWEIRKIVSLLESTEMSILDIAERTGRSHAAIASVNRRFQVREYGGRRTSWELSVESDARPSLRQIEVVA